MELLYKSLTDIDGYIEAYVETPKGVRYIYCKEENLENAIYAVFIVREEESIMEVAE